MVLSASLHLPTASWTVAVARHTLEGLLSTSGVAATAGADLVLALSEACSNAVRHAAGGRSYRVRLCIDDSRCLMEVRDDGDGFEPPAVPAPRPDTDGGRGLLIIRAVLDRVDVVTLRPRGTRLTMVKNWNHAFTGKRTNGRIPGREQHDAPPTIVNTPDSRSLTPSGPGRNHP